MKKLAIFVEGLTEQLFIKKLFTEVADANNVEIVEHTLSASNDSLAIKKIIAKSKDNDNKYYVLIVDVGSDSKVQSEVIENYESLHKQGFSKILGLRDVYPFSVADIPKMRRRVKYGVKTKPVHAEVLLAVMEVEAWFLAEHFHFSKINKRLDVALIVNHLGIDLTTCDVEQIPHPAGQLDAIYQLVGRRYKKTRTKLNGVIDKLDFSRIYLDMPSRVNSLKEIVVHVDDFLS